jgi:para-nitrobenzyl esterase
MITRREFLGAAAGCIYGPYFLFSQNAQPPILETTGGKIRGNLTDGVNAFKGIPYGEPTAGRRFQPPLKVQPWTGMRDTLEFGPRAFQFRADAPVNRSQPESEDCLVLNVWTPGLGDGKKRPVMFWCHDGGFSYGSGASSRTDGTNLARRHDVVVVTINHRLNVFGYLYLADLAPEYPDSGNVGMMDIVLALNWVKDNISNFGGDPGNVTIFGESGGGSKVSCLMAMPSAKGLFHRAIVESGSGVRMVAREDATKTALEALEVAGLNKNRIAELAKFPPEKMVEIVKGITHSAGGPGAGGPQILRPVVDGRSLPSHPFDPKAPETSAHVPLLVGTNKDETGMMYLRPPLEEADMRSRVRIAIGDDAKADSLVEYFRKTHPKATPTDLYVLITTGRMRMNAILQAERKAALGKAPVYMYLFTFEDPVQKSYHTLEIPFAFDNVDLNVKMTGGTPEARKLAENLSRAWVAFARTGSPNHNGIPKWDPYGEKDRATMLLNVECQLVSDPYEEDRLAFRN